MKLICFDFDNVIIDGNPVFKLLKKKKNYRKIFRTMIKHYDPNNFAWFVNKAVRDAKGMRFGLVRNTVLDTRLMVGVRKTFEKLRDNGFTIVVMSTNDVGIMKEYLEKHKLTDFVDEVYGTKLGVRNGILTGRISGKTLKTEKVGVLADISKKYGASRRSIIFVGDGLTDFPLMEKVGRSVLFCPNFITRHKFKKNKILREKKRKGQLNVIKKKDIRKILRFVLSWS